MSPSRGHWCCGWAALVVATILGGGWQSSAGIAATDPDGAMVVAPPPRFKWGQTASKIFLTMVVKELDKASVQVSIEEDRLTFAAKDASGKAYALDLELAQDVDPDGCHWEHLPRRDRWGDAVLATLLKRFPSPWEALLVDPPPAYRQAMDRDWAREDQSLEQPEEEGFFAEHEKYLPQLTEAGFLEARSGVDSLVILVRHAACKQCKVADDTFAAVAKTIGGAKRNSWKSRLRLRVVDPRGQSGRVLARRLGAFCAAVATECRYFAVAPSGETAWDDGAAGLAPIRIRGRHSESSLLADLQRLARKQFQATTAADAMSGRINASRGLVVLPASPVPELALAAHRLRLRLDIAVAKDRAEEKSLRLHVHEAGGEEAAALAAAWPPGEVEPHLLRPSSGPDGGSSATDMREGARLEPWLRARAVPILANTSTFEDDEPYEELGLPVARLFLNGSTGDAEARAAVYDVAASFVGKVAFFARNATAKAHEWRQHGLPPGRFPAFALALAMRHNATKYAFLDSEELHKKEMLVPGALAEFWRGPARERLRTFVEDALGGRLEPSKMSEALPEDGTAGSSAAGGSEVASDRVRKLVGRTCKALVEASETDALVEAYDEWRRDHKWRTLRLDLLAPMLARWNITVYRLDLGYNECPPDTLPLISAGYSGYFFVPRRAKERGKKWQKLKKLDPPFDRVLTFVEKHAEARPKPKADELLKELEGAASAAERVEAAKELATDRRAWAATAVLGLVGVLGFTLLRRRSAVAHGGTVGDGQPGK